MTAARHLGNVHIRVIKTSTKILLSSSFVNVYHQELTFFSPDVIFAYTGEYVSLKTGILAYFMQWIV